LVVWKAAQTVETTADHLADTMVAYSVEVLVDSLAVCSVVH